MPKIVPLSNEKLDLGIFCVTQIFPPVTTGYKYWICYSCATEFSSGSVSILMEPVEPSGLKCALCVHLHTKEGTKSLLPVHKKS